MHELNKRDSVLAAVNEIFEQIGFEKYRIDADFRLYHKNSNKDVNFTFTNKLSDGEKTLVAFSLFYAQIKLSVFTDADYIVIDDPVSSLDYENVYNIHTLIESLIKEKSTSKFIILTHNHIFYNFLLYKRSSQKSTLRDYNLYKIQKNEKNISEIIEDKSDSISVYVDKLVRINQIYSENRYHSHEVALIPNYCRYIIESIAIFFFPNSGDPVNSLFSEIRRNNKELLLSGQSAILSKSCVDILDKLVNVGSHAMVESIFDRERFSDQDYKTMCKGTIQIIKHFAPHQLHS